MKQGDKQQAEPAGPDVGNKHGTVVVAWFGEIIQAAFRAMVVHFKWPDKRPGAGFEGVALVATRAFEVENTVGFGAFLQKCHDR